MTEAAEACRRMAAGMTRRPIMRTAIASTSRGKERRGEKKVALLLGMGLLKFI